MKAFANAARKQDGLAPSSGDQVLHFVGRVTEEVFSFLGPATSVLTEAGIAQTVVMTDDPRDRHLHSRFHPKVQLVLTPWDSHATRLWTRSFGAFIDIARTGTWQAVHLHGFLPCVLGALALRAVRLDVALHYSPHGSRSLVSLRYASAALIKLLRLGTSPGSGSPSAMAGLPAEARTLGRITRQPVELVEHAVDPAFFAVERHETPHPLVVTGGSSQDPYSAHDFEQLAILLGGEALRIGFNWVGTVDSASAQHLKAANVGITEQQGAERRASRLAASWVYVASGSGRGFPLFMAEAMCVGLPCVAADTPAHRDVVIHGQTGFLCTGQEEMLRRISQLIDDADLRKRLGENARAMACERFAETRFRDSLRSAYGM